VNIAKDYLYTRGEDPAKFKTASVLTFEKHANQYLQKNLGFKKLLEFIKIHDFDMFFWMVRFFKENEKEGYRLTVSSSTGEITSFSHIIESTTERKKNEKEDAKKLAQQFLKQNFHFNPDLYTLKNDTSTKLDHREDFSFTWQKNNVNIPWTKEKRAGTGKLLIGAKVSGNEILSFSKNTFSVPEKFKRYLEKQRNTGRNLSTIVGIFYYIFFVAAIFFVISRRHHLAMHTSKNFYLGIMLSSFALSLLGEINQFEYILFNYKTTIPLTSFLWRFWTHTFINALFLTVAILMPSLAGESLHYESMQDKPKGSFLHYIRSTFLSRSVAESIFLGYFVFLIMIGIQSFLIEMGQKHWGVWIEHSWMDNLSSAYLPFLAAFTVGYKASFMEEIMFRLFIISWGKKLCKSLLIVAILSSFLWGFAHSNYQVFPMWFRGIEVTCLGLFLSYIYLRHGIIAVITAHYLFDTFWHSAGYLLGHPKPFYFYSAVFILILPCLFGLIAFILNKPDDEQPMRWRLNKHQIFNLEILKTFLNTHQKELTHKTPEQIKQKIASHGWDMAVVERAVEEMEDSK